MDLLNAATQAELNAEYRRAASYYSRLSKQGSLLDRVGICQAIARCYERLGLRKKAGYYHEKAGRGYLKLPTQVMGEQERAYYAMVEFRGAVQNYAPAILIRRATVDGYLKALNVCLKGGKEGYSHEMLFAAHLCAKVHRFTAAARWFAGTASQFKAEKQGKLARESFLLASMYSRKSGNLALAEKSRISAKAQR